MALPRRTKLITRFCLRRLSFLTYYAVMKRHEVLRKLKEAEADLRAQGVAHAALFGSVARGEDRPDSDIDIMIEIAPDSRMDLFRYVGIVQYVEELFPVPVDVANREGLKPFVRPSAERDAVYAF
jgi:predicted nucleotidyltransferase